MSSFDDLLCPECSRPGRSVLHADPRRCPFRGYALPVPCRNSTLRESIAGVHQTQDPERICSRCRAVALARSDAEGLPAGLSAPSPDATLLDASASRGRLDGSTPATSQGLPL